MEIGEGPSQFNQMSPEERRKIFESKLDEIYTRLDQARFRGGVDLNPTGRPSSPFRLEDAIDESEASLMYEYLKIIGEEIRKRAYVPKEIDGIKVHEFKRQGLVVRASVEGDEASQKLVGGNLDIELVDKDRKIDLKHITEQGHNNFNLKIDYPKDADYDALTYESSDFKDPMNMEEFVIASTVASRAYGEVFDIKPNLLSPPPDSPDSGSSGSSS